MFDVIIIGGGPSGMSAALYLLRENKKVLIIEKEAFGGQIATSPRLENYPSIKSISGIQFSDNLFEQISSLGVEFELDEVLKINKLDDKSFEVVTNYSIYNSRCVIIANGMKHRHLGLKNEEELIGKGISYCATCDGPFYKGEEVNVIGDANSALQYAICLASYCRKVNMYCLFDHLFGDKYLQDKVLDNPKITINYNMSLQEIIGNDNLEALVFKNTSNDEIINIKTNNVFVAIGQISDNDKFKDLIKLDNGFIVVDENMKTSLEGVFACGDTIKKEIRQVVNACSEGAIAALSAIKYLN